MKFLKPILMLGLLISSVLSSYGRDLEIYFIDVLGGAATLITTPAGESILIDSGWLTEENRDAKRIYNTIVNHAGLKQLDYSITTHWHRDHFGDILALREMLPIKKFYDRGIVDELPEDPEQYKIQIKNYQKASDGESEAVKPGDTIPLKQAEDTPQLEMICVAANQEVISGGEENPLCEEAKTRERIQDDNPNSLAFLLRYGDFEFFCGGDITWMVEHDLVCPNNTIGTVDLYMVNHHGFASSNNPTFLKSIKPQVAVLCNGPRKGGNSDVIKMLEEFSFCKALYQLHWNVSIPVEDNTDPDYIANLNPKQPGHFIKAHVHRNGNQFTMTINETLNSRVFQCKE